MEFSIESKAKSTNITNRKKPPAFSTSCRLNRTAAFDYIPKKSTK